MLQKRSNNNNKWDKLKKYLDIFSNTKVVAPYKDLLFITFPNHTNVQCNNSVFSFDLIKFHPTPRFCLLG